MIAGFELWVPPVSNEYDDGMPIWEILGTDAQFVQFPLKASRSVTCFSGAMAYMSDGIKMKLKLAGLMKTFGRLAGGGSLFQITYVNESDQDGYISMTPDYPGVIFPIDMKQYGEINAMRDSFLCSTIDADGVETEIGAGFNPAESAMGFCCGGVDFVVQTISGGEWAFLTAMGTVITRDLAEGETILVDTDSVLAMQTGVTVDIKRVGGCAAMCCAGAGLFHTELNGPGRVWMQSMGIDKMRRLFPPKVVETGGSSGGGDGGGE